MTKVFRVGSVRLGCVDEVSNTTLLCQKKYIDTSRCQEDEKSHDRESQ